MTALKLYKYINKNELSIDWRGDELILWIPFAYINDFTELLGYDYLSEGGIEVNLQDDAIALDIIPICEYFDIEPTEMLAKDE